MGGSNCHIGSYVEGNHPRTSPGGKLLVEFLSNKNYTLVNALDVVVNGPFTRYDPKDLNDDNKKSLLDFVIISSSLVKYIDELVIDKNHEWTPQ